MHLHPRRWAALLDVFRPCCVGTTHHTCSSPQREKKRSFGVHTWGTVLFWSKSVTHMEDTPVHRSLLSDWLYDGGVGGQGLFCHSLATLMFEKLKICSCSGTSLSTSKVSFQTLKHCWCCPCLSFLIQLITLITKSPEKKKHRNLKQSKMLSSFRSTARSAADNIHR